MGAYSPPTSSRYATSTVLTTHEALNKLAIITVQSVFSGAGATTIAANLSNALLRQGTKLSTVDACSHNDLRLWYGMPLSQSGGWALGYLDNISDSREFAFRSDFGATFLPLGEVNDNYDQLTNRIESDPQQWLSWLKAGSDDWLIINLPSHCTRLYQALIPYVDLHLGVWQAEPRVYPRMQQFIVKQNLHSEVPNAFVFQENGVAPQLELNRDISNIINHELADEVTSPVGIMRDQHVAEALATQQSCYEYSIAASANADFAELANWVVKRCSPA
ncbi:MAG: hypothetical protein CMF18_01760 [Idiomarinaceae bacterium]|nr:hypothetical protein [Idiomarinaceae bacterium]